MVNWEECKECKVHKLCADYEKERQVTITDVTKWMKVVQEIEQIDLERYKENICDITFVQNRQCNFLMLKTQNHCKQLESH